MSPIFDYHDEGSSIACCVIYNGRQFPSGFRGNLFHLDYTSNTLFRAILDATTVVSHAPMMVGEGGTVDLTELRDGTLAYCELLTGKLRRVRYIGPPEQVAGYQPIGPADDPEAEAAQPDASAKPQECGAGALTLLILTSTCRLTCRRW
jgi:hypothetical protein